MTLSMGAGQLDLLLRMLLILSVASFQSTNFNRKLCSVGKM